VRAPLLVAVAVALVATVFLSFSGYLLPPEPGGVAVSEPTVPTREYIVEAGVNRFVVVKPPSWSELFWLAVEGLASYSYITWYDVDTLWTLYCLYMQNLHGDPCRVLVETFKSDWAWYKFLLGDNCTWLKTFLFNTTPDWYLAHGFIEPLGRRVLEGVAGDAKVYVLAYRSSMGLHIEFYNILDRGELEELKRKLWNLTHGSHVFTLLEGAVRTWWYRVYRYLEANGIPYAILSDIGFKGSPGWKRIFEARKELYKFILGDHLNATYGPLDEPGLELVVFVDGEPVTVCIIDWPRGCRFFPGLICEDDEMRALEKALEKARSR